MQHLTRAYRWWLCMGVVLILAEGPAQVRAQDSRPLFEQRYQAWVQYRREAADPAPRVGVLAMTDADSVQTTSTLAANRFADPNLLFDNQPFEEIVALGVPAVPFMIEQQRQDHMLGHALYRITRWRYHVVREVLQPGEVVFWRLEEFPDLCSTSGPPDSRVIWDRWWKDGRSFTDARFHELYGELHSFSRQKNADQVRQTVQQITDLGLAALPLLNEEISRGHAELIPIVSILTDGRVSDTATRTECLRWWNDHGPAWLLPFGELPAAAN